MATYDLKTWPRFLADIMDGRKNFDVRKGEDRQYEVGDTLILREWDPQAGRFTGAQTQRRVGYVMHGGPFLPDDVWVLGFTE